MEVIKFSLLGFCNFMDLLDLEDIVLLSFYSSFLILISKFLILFKFTVNRPSSRIIFFIFLTPVALLAANLVKIYHEI